MASPVAEVDSNGYNKNLLPTEFFECGHGSFSGV